MTLRNCHNLIGMVRLEIRFGMCNELKIDDEKKWKGGLLKFLFPKQINMVNETVSFAEECTVIRIVHFLYGLISTRQFSPNTYTVRTPL